MLTASQFVKYLQQRRDTGETNAAIGESLGVSRQAVYAWLKGSAVPSDTVLLLAERLMTGEDHSELSPGRLK